MCSQPSIPSSLVFLMWLSVHLPPVYTARVKGSIGQVTHGRRAHGHEGNHYHQPVGPQTRRHSVCAAPCPLRLDLQNKKNSLYREGKYYYCNHGLLAPHFSRHFSGVEKRRRKLYGTGPRVSWGPRPASKCLRTCRGKWPPTCLAGEQ